ncbi:tail tip protein [Escherichia phage ES]|nr:tail tip protein [Escherichia phage ES]
MTKLYCVKNNSKTLPFTESQPYSGESLGDGYYKIYGDDMTHILAPIDGSLVEFIIAD